MPKCKLDPECEVPNNQKDLADSFNKKFDDLDIKVDCLDSKVNSADKKLTKIDTCVEKISQTLHGDSEIGFNGMIKSQKDQAKDIKDIQDLMWFPKLVDDFFKYIKKPVYLIILTGIFSFIVFIISIKLGVNPF